MYGNSQFESMYQLFCEFSKWAELMPYGNTEKAEAEGAVFAHCAKLLKEQLKKEIPLFKNDEEREWFYLSDYDKKDNS